MCVKQAKLIAWLLFALLLCYIKPRFSQWWWKCRADYLSAHRKVVHPSFMFWHFCPIGMDYFSLKGQLFRLLFGTHYPPWCIGHVLIFFFSLTCNKKTSTFAPILIGYGDNKDIHNLYLFGTIDVLVLLVIWIDSDWCLFWSAEWHILCRLRS